LFQQIVASDDRLYMTIVIYPDQMFLGVEGVQKDIRFRVGRVVSGSCGTG
jgi:hypothetical protein